MVILIICTKTFAQISPGDLSAPHAKFEGLDNCTKCHVLGDKVTSSKCLACHTEINEKLKSGSGYHSGTKVRGKECVVCHNEHHGRNFKLIKFDKNSFDHRDANFQLEGKHSSIKCEDCHNVKNQAVSLQNKRKDSYLGLKQSCISCHEDYHQGTLNSDCKQCHNNVVFKPAAFFNHNNALFKLTGAHLKLSCVKCHPEEIRNGKKFKKFKGIDFQKCTSCHLDVHQGKFGANCLKCHSTESFKSVAGSKFNHNLTNFPLTGKHINVNCANCHKGGMQVKLKYGKCTDCHEDYHKGDFTTSGAATDCSICHTTNGFNPAIFTIEDHNKARFILSGSHLALSCVSCHNNDGAWKFKFAETTCISCHKNIHGSELPDKFVNDCKNCHNEHSWSSIAFDHKLTGYSLVGKHADILCSSCHTNKTDNNIEYVFKSIGKDCESCHKDVHSGQFQINGKSNCAGCHIPESWLDSKFDHNTTSFPLTGAHIDLECSKCHTASVAANNMTFTVYKIGKSKCTDCHK